MKNGAYTLSFFAAIVGLGLLTVAPSGNRILTVLGTLLMVGAAVVAGFGKAIDLLGHVREGASDPPDQG